MNTTAQVKQAIKKSVQQVKQEPLELLKSAAKQITGAETTPWDEKPVEAAPVAQDSNEVPADEQKYKKQVAEQDGRRLEALNSEIQDITRQKIFNDLMRRIQGGEDVPIEEFSELSFEQKDVLKAQMEAAKTRNSQPVTNQLDIPQAKRGRKMGGGQKGAAKKEQTRVEKPVPPSG
jgi:hypothetical protein